MTASSAKRADQRLGYWAGKRPCWEVMCCPEPMRNQCPAYNNPDVPGWLAGGLYCQLFDSRRMGGFTDVCRQCRVYLGWGDHSLN